MRLTLVLMALAALPITSTAQSAVTGTVLESGTPVEAASVFAARSNKSIAAEAVTDSLGRFRLAPLAAGLYTITVRKVGYRVAERAGVRVGEDQTVSVSVALTQATQQLSTITVISTPTSIDASTPELSLRLDREFTALLPSARDASSLIALVPGARTNQLWGGAPGVSNDYQLDGISVNHPGLGGDFLALSVDWIEALDVRGLGAGAEHGNFQGGIINAITRTGTNDRRMAFRTNYESAGLTATNFNANEQGVEQAGRREASGEISGPIARDRLFYFAGAQIVGRDLRSPNLTTAAPRDFQAVQEEHLNARGLGKLTWRPAARGSQRVDALFGFGTQAADHAGINGVDDPSATLRTRQPTAFYELGWSGSPSARNAVDVRLAGYNAIESRLGYQGSVVPAVQPVTLGREPTFQNSAFDERRHASSTSGTIQWRTSRSALRAEHELVVGAEATRGHWGNQRTRNGGVTWRPYTFGIAAFDPVDASTWGTTASEWGGDIRLDSDVSSVALFAQDYVSVGSRLTLTPGLRYGRWGGALRGLNAARADGFDPRIGVVWDVTGRNTLALKAHWGRYHQGMYALFFDRALIEEADGANIYTNRRMYYSAPSVSSARTSFTVTERDAAGSGFSTYYGEEVLDETGRVERYKQPYVDQAMLGLEKGIGRSWKVEVVYAHRRNRDIVGLIDRNAASNYSVMHNVKVDDQFALDYLRDARGKLLVLPTVYVSNKDLKAALLSCVGAFDPTLCPTSIGGYSLADPLEWNPAYVLTTIPGAKRAYEQLTVMLRTYQPRWRGEASFTKARLIGNVAGVAGFGTTGTRFSAGPYAHPNEAMNDYGPLPDALELEGKVWLTVKLPFALEGGVLFTHTLGERFAPTFEFEGRYVYHDSLGTMMPAEIFRSLLGQPVFVEPRGSWHYPSRDVVDLHLEWQSPKAAVVTVDLFNALGSDALTSVNTRLGGQLPDDPSTNFLAGRLRVAPRTLRIGARIPR
ncbi:MAG TPA: TonB-dependent receptor [Gemmatimonadaceae bacterium]|nr:TonB-dependent receptor [Gemmatimonadaceae bacterium]